MKFIYEHKETKEILCSEIQPCYINTAFEIHFGEPGKFVLPDNEDFIYKESYDPCQQHHE